MWEMAKNGGASLAIARRSRDSPCLVSLKDRGPSPEVAPNTLLPGKSAQELATCGDLEVQ